MLIRSRSTKIVKDTAQRSTHPRRGANPRCRHAPKQAERAPARTPARSPLDLENHSAGGYYGGSWGRGLAETSQWAGEGRAGAELGYRAPIGQLALRYADAVESRARGRDDFLLEANAGRGRGHVWPGP